MGVIWKYSRKAEAGCCVLRNLAWNNPFEKNSPHILASEIIFFIKAGMCWALDLGET